MITARGVAGGRPLFICGLTHENLDRLLDDQPICFDAEARLGIAGRVFCIACVADHDIDARTRTPTPSAYARLHRRVYEARQRRWPARNRASFLLLHGEHVQELRSGTVLWRDDVPDGVVYLFADGDDRGLAKALGIDMRRDLRPDEEMHVDGGVVRFTGPGSTH